MSEHSDNNTVTQENSCAVDAAKFNKSSKKDALRLSVSDPQPQHVFTRTSSPGLRDRRARWIYNMNRAHNRNENLNQSDRKKSSRSENGTKRASKYGDTSRTDGNATKDGGLKLNKSFSGRSKTCDSGYNGVNDFETLRVGGQSDSEAQSSMFETVETPDSTFDSPYKSFHGPRWASTSRDRKLRLGCSLPFEVEQEDDFEVHTPDQEIEIEPNPHSLSRQNGIRYSLNLRRKLSPSSGSSISSESEASQEGCENALNPTLLLPNGLGVVPGGRKQSVLFSSYDAWNEETIAQSFREMTPQIGNVLEAAWSGENGTLEELLKESETLDLLRKGQLRDREGRTPLHLGSACGNKETVQLLLDKGAEVNEFDNEKATPLSCAASCGSLSVLEILLDHGADVNAGYDYGKTALHWSIQAGSVDCAKKLLEMGALQNPPQIFSETPLHVSATLGDVNCLQLLLDYGADTTLCKGPNRSTALHLSAEEGNAACITILMAAGANAEAKDLRGHSPLHIAATCDADSVLALLKGGANPNATDLNGRTSLHCAVSRGSRAAECVRMLVEKGADIDAQDNFGYTPLHLAAVNESSACASILLSHGADVTSKNKAGTTALTLLVRKIPDVMRYLVDRLDAAVTIHDHEPGDPDCEIRLDFRGIVPNVDKKHGGFGSSAKEQTYYLKPRKETEFLTCLLAAGNKKILAHPLSEAFLTLKWQRVRKFFWASLLFQIALVALFTIFVVEVYLIKCPHKRYLSEDNLADPIIANPNSVVANNGVTETSGPPLAIQIPILDNLPTSTDPSGPTTRAQRHLQRRAADSGWDWFSFNPKKNRGNRNRTRGGGRKTVPTVDPEITTLPPSTQNPRVRGGFRRPEDVETTEIPPAEEDGVIIEETRGKCEIGIPLTVIWGLLVAFAILMAIKEIFQLLQSPFSYVVSSENWGQWALIGSVTMTAYISPGYELSYWQYPAAAVGIFLAWGLMLLQVGRFPALGLYVQMLGKVAANFGLFILAYACLLIAFALAFCVLFPEHPPYSSVPAALLKVLTMMVGEVDYENLFYNEDNANDPVLYPITAHILHAFFVIIVTIVLMNLLVGLAVHDIQGLQKGAKLNRLSRQTALISRLESFIFSKRLQSCLPRSIGSILQKSALLVPSSYNWSYYFRPNDTRDQRLPKDLKIAALRVAASKHSSKTIRGHPDIRLHPSSNSYSGSVKNPTVVEQQTTAAVRRIEQRLDRLQLQLDLVLKTFNDKFETLSIVVNEKHRADKRGSVVAS